MRRREFVIVSAAFAATGPLRVAAQPAARVRCVGVLTGFAENDPSAQSYVEAFRQRLRALGWIEGRDLKLEIRWATAGNIEMMRDYAAELARLAPDAVLVHGGRAIAAIRRESRDIPVIFAGVSDAIDAGLVTSLARPGGNITGFTTFEGSIVGKQMALLKEIAPGLRRVAYLVSADVDLVGIWTVDFEVAAQKLELSATILRARDGGDIRRVIETFATEPDAGLILSPDVTIFRYRKSIAVLAAEHRLPSITSRRDFAIDGGLMSYGADMVDNYRNAATYVDRILRGEKAGDLPVQQPTRYQLWLNLKTAKALALAVPVTLLATADEVIE